MERPRRQGASQDRRQPRKKRRPSPLPGAPSDRAGSRAGVSRPCRRRLFGSAGPPGPQPGSLKGRSRVKSLPKIKENHEVSQVSHSCNQSNQVNVQETTDLEKKEEKMEESTVSVKESLMINFESKGSLKNPEVTSSTGMTLPTGVSTFLLQCLDEDSTADYNAGSGDNLNSCLSPEIFRNNISEKSNFDAVDPGKYKNSTLLDSSKAVTIDKMPQISSLSPISEPVLEDFQDQYATRKRPLNCNYSSSLDVSTTVTGKKVCKITAARERTPDLKTGMRCSSPLGPARKPGSRTAETKRPKCKEKQKKRNMFEEGQPDAPGNTSAKSEGSMAEVPPTKQRDTAVQTSPTLLILEENRVLENLGSAQPAEQDPLCGRREICCIVRTSPCRRPPSPHQIPVNTKAFSPPEGVPEDVITSTKNWICCKHK
ncbi:meiosis-specific kinetochore protein isoform X2 [Patagioenas fasciata]|uniref:meiosis-specific kinetochore protein isoform X2 n=1 Tax=Patagioenas fasciata TaxID=372321 RepID=UPI0032E91345